MEDSEVVETHVGDEHVVDSVPVTAQPDEVELCSSKEVCECSDE